MSLGELVERFVELGRMGGVILLAATMVLWVGSAWLWASPYGVPVILPALGLVSFPLGVVLVVRGAPSRFTSRKPPGEVPLTPAFVDQVRNEPRPFYACTHCKVICDLPVCETCFRTVDVLPVEDDRDLRTLLAALGSDDSE